MSNIGALVASPFIPKGLRPPAQGCDEEATLGHRPINDSNRNAVVAAVATTPLELGEFLAFVSQGSSFVATLGFEPESLWDSRASIRTRADVPKHRLDGANHK